MPLLTVFLLTAACLPVAWWESPLGLDRRESARFTAAAVAAPLLLAFGLRTWVVRTLRRDPFRRPTVARAYGRLRQLLYFFNVGCVLLAVLGLGWGHTVQETLSVERTVPWSDGRGHVFHDRLPVMLPFAELAVPLPYFVMLVGLWVIYFDAERALHRAVPAHLLGPDPGRPFWSRGGYLLNNARLVAFIPGLPVGLFVAQQTVARWFPETSGSDLYRLASLAGVAALMVFLPRAVRPLLGLRPMPPGPTRDRLEALARRLDFRYSELLVWPTRGGAVNAMVAGLIPRVRYVVFTDRLLDDLPPEEVDAVFGHEIGHVRHGHIGYYALFLGLSMVALAAVVLFALEAADAALAEARFSVPPEYRKYEGLLAFPPVMVMAAYVFVVFGFLSRRCERQADVFGARAVSCGNPRCLGHDGATVYAPNGAALCPTGLRTFAHALERVELLNGGRRRGLLTWLKSWQHGPIHRRVDYVLSLIRHPDREPRFQRSVAVLRWGLVVGLTAVLVLFAEQVGWQKLLQTL